jgi:hypothetical protein
MSLDEQEAFHAAIAGLMRNFHSRKRGWKHHSGDKSKVTDWGNHIESAMAEALVAKALKMFWYRVSDEPWNYADVGPYQVRHTIYFDGGLAISPKDNDDQIFILVVGAFPHQSIVGWQHAKDCKVKRYYREEFGVYIVPQDELNKGLPA